jgi:hypothetical protein
MNQDKALTERNRKPERGDMEEQHVYHHQVGSDEPKINVKAEKNSRGYNYEATVTGCANVEQAMELLDKVMESLQRTYGTQPQA